MATIEAEGFFSQEHKKIAEENGTHTFDNDKNALNKAIAVSIEFIKIILKE